MLGWPEESMMVVKYKETWFRSLGPLFQPLIVSVITWLHASSYSPNRSVLLRLAMATYGLCFWPWKLAIHY